MVRWVEREINWSEEAEAHIGRHGVTPGDVEDVIYTRPRLVLDGRNGTTLVYGTTKAGRHVLVVLSEAMDGRWYVVTSREMTAGERRIFSARGQ